MSADQETLRVVIREIVREVIRDVIAEEVAASTMTVGTSTAGGATRPGPRPQGSEQAPASVVARGALTERHVRAAGKGGTVTIARSVVVTPLARERAKSWGVEIIRIDG